MAEFRRGDVYFVPPETRDAAYQYDRRHVLLRDADSESSPHAVMTAAYASRQSTPRVLGATCYDLDGTDATNRNCGFPDYTYIYPGIVTSTSLEDLTDQTGQLGRHWSRVHAKLRRALGIGTGVRDRHKSSDSWRGVVVRVTPDFSAESGFTFGVVVTEHAYSAAKEWLTLIPILDAADLVPEGSEFVEDVRGLLRSEADAFSSGLLSPELLTSAYQPSDIHGVVSLVGLTCMARIDEALVAHFGL